VKRKHKHKQCFVNEHCSYDCPNFAIDEFEEFYDLPASEAGLERIKCKDCYLDSYECKDCYLRFDCQEADKLEGVQNGR